MPGTEKNEQILFAEDLKDRFVANSPKGFSLVEISVVLVIIGLMLGAGVTFWRSSIASTRLSTTRTNLDNIKNSVISFAIANGRLPCPDTTIPPNNTGVSNPDPTACGTSCSCTCANPPCHVPFQTLQLQLPGGRDSFGSVFFYDISYDTAAGAQGGLTNTTQGSFCGVLFEYLSHAADAGVLRVPCVTNQNDGADDGNIGAAGQGYGVASVAISQTPAENVFNAPLGLTGKNVAGSSREYETANRTNDNTYGNLIAELTYGELYNKVCTTQKTKIRIQNNSGATHYARLAGTNGCVTINSTALGVCAAGDCYIDIYQGSSIAFYSDSACTTTACGSAITFNMSATNDAGTTDWNGASVNGRDGNVQITGALTCTLSDNASTHGIP